MLLPKKLLKKMLFGATGTGLILLAGCKPTASCNSPEQGTTPKIHSGDPGSGVSSVPPRRKGDDDCPACGRG